MNKLIDKYPIHIQLGTAVIIIIFLISSVWAFSGMFARTNATIQEIDDRVSHLSEKYVNMRVEITDLQKQSSDVNTRLSVLEEILKRIEASQKEILNRIK